MSNYLSYDIIHLDITFTKSDEIENLIPIILNLVNIGKKVIVRANWLNGPIANGTILELSNINVDFYVPIADHYTAYQFYMTFYQKEIDRYEVTDAAQIAMQIRNNALRMKSYDPFDVITEKKVDTASNYMLTNDIIERMAIKHNTANFHNIKTNLKLYSTLEVYRALIVMQSEIFYRTDKRIPCIVLNTKLKDRIINSKMKKELAAQDILVNSLSITNKNWYLSFADIDDPDIVDCILEEAALIKLDIRYRCILSDLKMIMIDLKDRGPINFKSEDEMNRIINEYENVTVRKIESLDRVDIIDKTLVRDLMFRMCIDGYNIHYIYRRLRKLLRHSKMDLFDFRSTMNRFLYHKDKTIVQTGYTWSSEEFEQYISEYENTIFNTVKKPDKDEQEQELIKTQNIAEYDEDMVLNEDKILNNFLGIISAFMPFKNTKKSGFIKYDHKTIEKTKQFLPSVVNVKDNVMEKLEKYDDGAAEILKKMTIEEFYDDLGDEHDMDDDFISGSDNEDFE